MWKSVVLIIAIFAALQSVLFLCNISSGPSLKKGPGDEATVVRALILIFDLVQMQD